LFIMSRGIVLLERVNELMENRRKRVIGRVINWYRMNID